jgi:hypothetical protein
VKIQEYKKIISIENLKLDKPLIKVQLEKCKIPEPPKSEI